ncbi:MAG: flagellar assembly protein FliX [Pseudomonadota bacterium]
MKIDRVNTARSGPVKRSDRATGSSGARFADNLPDESPVGEAVGGGAIGPVQALLSLQEVPDATQGRRKSIQRAKGLLDGLEDLHRALVMGNLDEGRLLSLRRQLTQSRPQPSDPELEALVTQIEIRVEVELATRGL